MNLAILATVIYGILSIGGGILGYTKVKSTVSLASGIVSGVLLLLGGILQQQGNPFGLIFSVIVTGILIAVFIVRLVKTRKFMPAGVMVIAGAIVLITILLQNQGLSFSS